MKRVAVFEFYRRLAEANPAPETELEYVNPYSLLVAVALSAQSTDVGVNKATRSLFTKVTTPQAMLDLGQNMIQLREDDALLQAQIDSLRGVVAYQDSILRQLAALSGLSMRSQAAPMP